MADVTHVLKEVRAKFKGAIYLLGPLPRFFKNCCDIPSHHIKDDLHETVDMVKYTEAFTTTLMDSVCIPSRAEIVSFKEIFGAAVSPDLVRDNIHLSDPAKLKFAKFIVRLLLRTPNPIPKKPSNNRLSFSARLSKNDISISPTIVGFEEEEESMDSSNNKDAANTANKSTEKEAS